MRILSWFFQTSVICKAPCCLQLWRNQVKRRCKRGQARILGPPMYSVNTSSSPLMGQGSLLNVLWSFNYTAEFFGSTTTWVFIFWSFIAFCTLIFFFCKCQTQFLKIVNGLWSSDCMGLQEGFTKKVAVLLDFVQITFPPSPNLDNLYHFPYPYPSLP